MVDLEANCLPVATTLDWGEVTWGWGSPFLVILVSNFFQVPLYRPHMEST